MVQVSVILKVPLFFSFCDKSRLVMTEDSNSKNTLLTPGVTNTTTERYNYSVQGCLLVSLHSSMYSAP